MRILEQTGLTFDDVLLVPYKGTIASRFNGDISLATSLWEGMTLKYPIISANMDTVTEHQMAIKLAKQGGLGIIHRFMDIKQHVEELSMMGNWPSVSCIGTGVGGKERLHATIEDCDSVLIDVAHGHCLEMIDQIKWVKDTYPQLKIIAGNVSTAEGTYDLIKAGADCIKVGVGPGSLCTTRVQTGNGIPQLTAVIECASVAYEYERTVIADGGIKTSGDITKALAAGADAVMLGGLLAGTTETPGTIFHDKSSKIGPYKVYRGMASQAAQESWKGRATSVEGEVTRVHWRGPVEDVFNSLVNGILSGMSYQDARNLKELRENAVFIKQTTAGYRESLPHGL